MSLSRGFRVLHKQGHPYSVLIDSRHSEDGILLESETVVSLSPSEKEELKQDYVKAIDGYGCLGVIKFVNEQGGEAQSLYLVLVTACMTVGKLLNCEVFRITGVSFFSLQNGAVDGDSRCTDVKKLLSSGKFYFATQPKSGNAMSDGLDLTVSLQNQDKKDEENRFFWNHLLHLHFKHFGIDCSSWLFRVMCGGVDIRTVYVGALQAKAAIISRLSCERAGTRFNVRGVNDEGNVANFVESEQVIFVGNNISSFLQVRGSIPLFWEQPGLNVGSHKVKMSRGYEASAPAYEQHFSSIVEHYGQCVVINLLGSKEGENMLSKLFQGHHENSVFKDVIPMICFDYHSECRGGKGENLSRLKAKIWKEVESFGTYTYKHDEKLRITQTGVVRVNCLDCLDRTNSTETYFGLHMVGKQLECLGIGDNKQLEDRFKDAFKAAWPVTGDLISRMYAGTGALEGKTKLKDGARSVTRAIQNNFLDQNKQNAIDLLILGKNTADVELAARSNNLLSGDCLRAPPSVLRGMCDTYKQYTSPMQIRIAIGTWNVNGGKHFRSIAYKDQTLDSWLLNGHLQTDSSKNVYRAVFDFASNEEGDLPFANGDIIKVEELLEDGEWMSGSCNGVKGIFPASYVTKVLPKYTALFDFPAQQSGDLGFSAGDIIEVTDMAGEWWKGKVFREEYNPDEPEGSFPANFVEICRDSQEQNTENVADNKDESDVDWNKACDIYVIGFQEMVELSAGNIVNTSHTNQHAWGIELQKTISSNYKYVLVTSEQLVGVCLYVFARPHHAPHIRNVEVTVVKTGMGGATGNKGGIGIRMQFYNSSLCFVCSHLAAGQSQVQDRNNDFSEICKKMVFSGSKSLFCHDYVFWCGDLNYRIDMPLEEVKELVKSEDWETLKAHDQLCLEKEGGKVFQFFREGETNFAPTYKYDLFSDDYDTSEKSRTPAWTDRVLWYRRKWFTEQQKTSLVKVEDPDWSTGNLLHYGRAELKTSDHRPVIAILDVDVLQSDEEHLDKTFHEVVSAQGPLDASVLVSLSPDETGDELPLSGDLFDSLMKKFQEIGEVILTRHFKGKLLVIFKEGWMALRAVSLNGSSVNGTPVYVILKTGGWEQEIEQEIRHRALSTSFNDSRMEEISGQEYEAANYDYEYHAEDSQELDQTEDVRYDEYQNQKEEQNYVDDYNSHQEEVDTYEEEPSTVEFEVGDDPGWACETESYYPPEPAPKKVSPPPRPPSGPVKKQPPPRPTTLPTIPVGPPPVPSKSPSMRPGPPDTKPGPPPRPPAITPPSIPASILVPEPAPIAPKFKPRTNMPKRRAPAPPPGIKANTSSVKPKAPPPPLPFSPPKGPVPNQRRTHNNNAFIPENRSAPSLLDFDPLGGSSSLFDAPILQPNASNTLPLKPVQSNPTSQTSVFNESPRRSSYNSSSSISTGPPITSKPNPFPVQFGLTQAPIRPHNPNYKPMLQTIPSQSSTPAGFMGGGALLQPMVPLKPTVAPKPVANGARPPAPHAFGNSPFTMNSQHVDPFGANPFVSQQANKSDPWGAAITVDKNANDIPNSFSTDFSNFNFK